MSTDLSPENEKYIQSQIARGAFASREAALEAGVDLLRRREELAHRIRESRRPVDMDEFTEYDEAPLGVRFADLIEKARGRHPANE